MKFNNLDIFQSIKLRIYTDIILPISLKLNFTPSILGCYGLMFVIFVSLFLMTILIKIGQIPHLVIFKDTHIN